MSNNAIVMTGNQRINDLKQMLAMVKEVRNSVLLEKVDYGTIPGTQKPTLYKAGAEKIMRTLRLRPNFEALDETINFERNFIMYRYRCQLMEVDTNLIVAESIGSCNSYEDKYRWRWVPQHEIPAGVQPAAERTTSIEEFKFAVEKRETTGKYGKPDAYWEQFDEAIADNSIQLIQKKTKNGSSPAYRIESTLYQVPNPRVFDVMNTLDKMAQKRAFVSAVLMAGNVSEYFTVDIEDLPDFTSTLSAPIEITNPDEIDSLREKFLKSDDIQDAEIVDESPTTKQSKTKQFPKDEVLGEAPTTKKDPKDRRLGANTMTDPPTSKTWGEAPENRKAFLDYGVALGLGEDANEVWSYIQTRYNPGETMVKFRDVKSDTLDDGKKRLDELAADLHGEMMPPKPETYDWNLVRTGALTEYLKAAFNRSIAGFDNLAGEPIQAGVNFEQAINECCNLATIRDIPVFTTEIEYVQHGKSKEMIFHMPKIALGPDGKPYRHVMTDDAGRDMPFRLFGGRTAMKKLLGTERYEEMGIDAWEPGNTYTLDNPIQFLPEVAFNKDAVQYMKVVSIVQDKESKQEIPF